jgi:hypothetical protein
VADINGNGTGDIATAYGDSSGRPFVAVRDLDGTALRSATRIGQTGFEIVDLESMPGGDAVAVLTHNPQNGKVRIVVVDLRTGTKDVLIKGGRRHEVLALAVIPNVVDGTAGVAVLERNKAGGKLRVTVRRSDNGRTVATIGIGFEAVDLQTIGDLGRSPAPDLAVLGSRSTGTPIVVVADSRTGKRVSTIRFPLSMEPVALAVQRTPNGDPSETLIAVGITDDGGTLIATADGRTKRVIRSLDLPVAIPIAAEALPDVGGTPTPDLAVLGLAEDGTVTAIVIDPSSGRIISGPEFPRSLQPRDLAMVAGIGNSGVALASLGLSAAGDGSISLRDVVSGRDLGSLSVP